MTLAEAVSRSCDAHVALLHVGDAATFEEVAREGGDKARAELEKELEASLELLHKEHFGAPVQTELTIAANAASAIIEHGDAVGADLIVVATHGRTGLSRLLMGSVSERVVRHAPCSVLVARSALDEEEPR